MMMHDNRYEAKKVFRNYKEIEGAKAVEWFSYSEKSKNVKIGDFILFQHIQNNTISRPILAVFVGFSMWDMAVVMSFVEIPRAYYYSDKYMIGKDEDYTEYIGHMDPEIETIQFWTGNINLLGHFKGKPTLKDIRNSLKRKL